MISRRFTSLPIAGLVAVLTAVPPPLTAEEAPNLGELRGVWRADFNDDASRIVVQMRDGSIGIWDGNSEEPISVPLGEPDAKGHYGVDPAAARILVGFESGRARVFDFKSGEPVSPPLNANPDLRPMPGFVFTPDGLQVAVLDKDGSWRVFEIESGQLVASIPLPAGSGDSEIPTRIQFIPDGKTILMLDPTGTLRKFDAQWKSQGRPMLHPNESAYHIGAAVSDDGRYAATFDSPGENGPDGKLQLWDLTTCRPVGEPIADKNGVSARFLGRGDRLLVTPGRGTTRVLRVPSLELDLALPRHDDVEASQALPTSDDRGVFTFGYDSTLRLTDLETGKPAGIHSSRAQLESVITGPEASSAWLVFDNSAFILQDHYDYYVIRLGLEKMKPVASLRVTDFLHRTILSPDGSRLMTHTGMSGHERIRVFDAESLTEINGEGP